jgi:hypothetical protein
VSGMAHLPLPRLWSVVRRADVALLWVGVLQSDDALKRINAAYAVLSTPAQRRQYDMSHGTAGLTYGDANAFSGAYKARVAAEARRQSWNARSDGGVGGGGFGGVGGGGAGVRHDGGLDWEAWNRAHFGAADDQRAHYYEQTRMGGFRSARQGASVGEQAAAFSRQRASEFAATRGLSETKHYREYAERCVSLSAAVLRGFVASPLCMRFRACVRACVRVCVRACVCVCPCVCVTVWISLLVSWLLRWCRYRHIRKANDARGPVSLLLWAGIGMGMWAFSNYISSSTSRDDSDR